MSYLEKLSFFDKLKLLFIVNYLNLIYHFKRITMAESIDHISEIINSYLSSTEFQNTSEAEKNNLREKLEIEFLDIYHKEILKHLEPFLYEEFYQLSKEGKNEELDAFLNIHLYDYNAVSESAYIKFISNLIGYKNSEEKK